MPLMLLWPFKGNPKRRRIPSLKDEDIPRYPPYTRGLPAVSEEDLLVSQAELVDRISQTSRYSDEHFRTWYLPAMRRYARFVHLLPASETHHHRGMGGLLRHGFEAGLIALSKITNGGAFLAMDVLGQERKRVIPCWELACFLAGLVHDMGKPLADLVVTELDGQNQWDPHREDLVAWARRNDIARYSVRFRPGARHKTHEPMTLMAAHYVLTDEVRTYLSTSAPGVLEKLMAAISGAMTGRNLIQDCMNVGDQKSVEKDLRVNRLDGGIAAEVGVPVERNILDAMRRLVKSGLWKPNTPGGRVWVIAGNLFITWRQAAEDIATLLAKDRVPGIPRDPDTLADILLERDLACPCTAAGQTFRYWKIAPEVLQKIGEKTVELTVLRLQSAELVVDPPPVSAPGAIVALTPEPPRDQLVRSAPATPQEAPPAAGPAAPAAAGPEMDEPWLAAPIPLPEHPPSRPPDAPGGSFEDVPLPKEEESYASAEAELILPEEPGDDPVPRTGKKKEPGRKPKGSGSPAERKAATARLVPQPAPEDPASPSECDLEKLTCAEQFFEGHNLVGEVLKALAEDLGSGRAAWGQAVIVLPADRVAIRYPAALADYGADPKTILGEMDRLEWVAIDPAYPLRKVQDVDGFEGKSEKGRVKAVVLEGNVSQPFLTLARHKRQPAVAPAVLPGEEEPWKETPPARPPAPIEEPQQEKTPGKASRPRQGPTPPENPIQEMLASAGKGRAGIDILQKSGRLYFRQQEAMQWLTARGMGRNYALQLLVDSDLVKHTEIDGEKLFMIQQGGAA